jgi:superfamily II DNA helicase RecQ
MSLTAYELERLENMNRNAQHLRQLGLAPGDGLVPARLSATQDKKRKRAAPKPTPEPQEPQRRSSRLKNVAAPNVYVEEELEQPRRASRPVTLGGIDAMAVLAEADREEADALPIEPEQLTPLEQEVYECIREVRNAKARSMERSMFIVCGNRTMVEMCRLVPSTKDELLELHGMGELKVQRYGDLLLDALRPHAARLHAEHAAMEDARAAAAKAAGATASPPLALKVD